MLTFLVMVLRLTVSGVAINCKWGCDSIWAELWNWVVESAGGLFRCIELCYVWCLGFAMRGLCEALWVEGEEFGGSSHLGL